MKKKRKMGCILLCLMVLTGCAAPGEVSEQMITMATQTADTIQTTEQQPSREKTISFVYQGERIAPGSPLPQKTAEEAVSSQQLETCVGVGMETLYQYDGFDITVENDGADLVYSIYITSPEIATPEGVSIGTKLDKVLALYGEPDSQSGMAWIYTDGITDLIFLTADNEIVGMEYRASAQ